MQFNCCKYTFWTKLLQELSQNTIRYRDFQNFELINSKCASNNYRDYYIPIHELIIFSKILEKEGGNITYNFEKIK